MDELNVYLQNHWAAAAGGEDLARRIARTHDGTDVGPDLAVVAREVVEDREALGKLMRLLGLDPGTVAPVVVRVAERVGRLKPNGHLVRRSPASDVLELEALRGAVSAKRAGWDALLVLSDDLARVDAPELERLLGRADGQLARLTRVHAALARRSLARAV
jgi:hypothetical protein